MVDLADLQGTLGISVNDLSLLEQAMVHSSYINENPTLAPASNERLEFLGDAVLDFVVAEKLYRDFPDLAEGEMTRLRSALVCRDCLTSIASAIRLGDYLYMGKGEADSGGRHKPANLSGALEAVIAAIFLDQGLAVSRDFILRLFDEELLKVVNRDTVVDYKSRLQELIQSRYQSAPIYRLVEAMGPDHDRRFTVEVIAGGAVTGRGSGKSKKIAETEAARSALKQLSASFTQ